ncbi:MAG: T9SS type A sorting domain-containing protein [Ignavibacteria bacterium]|nr:T9SS type A sorting domain-containing protein [Ignavibacteria bacterium]
MKKILVLIFVILISGKIYSQNDFFNFLPLKVGNTWIYSGGSGGIRLKINGTTIANNHLYYTFEHLGTLASCAQGPCTPFLTNIIYPMRIDSVTGNLLILIGGNTCPWLSGEVLVDSLKMKTGDIINNNCFFSTCGDTNVMNIFGVSRRTKQLGQPIMTYFTQKRYVYGIGIYSALRGCFFSSCGYNLNGCVIDGTVYGDTGFIIGINNISNEIPNEFSLSQNYPNPFNPVTHFGFRIAKFGFVKLTVYDALGKEVHVLVNQQLQSGTYEADWDASAYSSGVYYYKLESENFTETRKMVLIK